MTLIFLTLLPSAFPERACVSHGGGVFVVDVGLVALPGLEPGRGYPQQILKAFNRQPAPSAPNRKSFRSSGFLLAVIDFVRSRMHRLLVVVSDRTRTMSRTGGYPRVSEFHLHPVCHLHASQLTVNRVS